MVGNIPIKWYNNNMVNFILKKIFGFTNKEIKDVKKRFNKTIQDVYFRNH